MINHLLDHLFAGVYLAAGITLALILLPSIAALIIAAEEQR